MTLTTRRRHSEDTKATALAALAANGGNVGRTARQLSLPRKTLERWAKGGVPDHVAQSGHVKKGVMADALEQIAWQLAEAIPDKIADATLSQTMTSLGIAIDKSLLLRQAAGPDPYSSMSRDELQCELDARLSRLAELDRQRAALIARNGPPPLGLNETAQRGGETVGGRTDLFTTEGRSDPGVDRQRSVNVRDLSG